jgi:hypothetical protein
MNVFSWEWLGCKDLREQFHRTQQRMSKKYEPDFWGFFVRVE